MDTTEPVARHPDDDTQFTELNRLLLSTDSFEAFLTELVDYAGRQIQHGCSITARTRTRGPYTVVATDDVSLQLDERQYEHDRGPCLEALRSMVPVFVPDMAAEVRWEPFPNEATSLGVHSSMSYPLISGGNTIGALNMYAFTTLTPDVGRNARAAQLADRAAGALAVGMRLAEQSVDNESLRAALTSRTLIDQAIGILMAQQRCSPQDAFTLLRQASQSRNIRLRDVAAQIVESAQRHAPGKPRGRY